MKHAATWAAACCLAAVVSSAEQLQNRLDIVNHEPDLCSVGPPSKCHHELAARAITVITSVTAGPSLSPSLIPSKTVHAVKWNTSVYVSALLISVTRNQSNVFKIPCNVSGFNSRRHKTPDCDNGPTASPPSPPSGHGRIKHLSHQSTHGLVLRRLLRSQVSIFARQFDSQLARLGLHRHQQPGLVCQEVSQLAVLWRCEPMGLPVRRRHR
jgi:hypothetical protein